MLDFFSGRKHELKRHHANRRKHLIAKLGPEASVDEIKMQQELIRQRRKLRHMLNESNM